MDDLDFLRGMEGESSEGTDLVQGAEHFIRLKKQVGYSPNRDEDLELPKTAGISEALKTIDPGLLAAVGLGATVSGAGTYLASRPQANGKSKAEEDWEGVSQAQKNRGEPSSLTGKMRNAGTDLMHGYSKAFKEHPVKAGLLGLITGGTAGYGVARMAGANKPSIEAIKAALRGVK